MIKFEDVRPGDVFLRTFNPRCPMLVVVRETQCFSSATGKYLSVFRYNVISRDWYPRALVLSEIGYKGTSHAHLGNLFDSQAIAEDDWEDFLTSIERMRYESR